jgi:hypothetical protein
MSERKGLQRRTLLDPAVADLLTGMEQKQAEYMLPRRARLKKSREQAKIAARRELRATYDLPPALRQRVRLVAEKERLPASQLVTLALVRFFADLDDAKVDLAEYKQPSRSPRYDWNLVLPEDSLASPRSPRKKSP